MSNFLLEDFKDGKFAVQCKTECSAVDFFKTIRQTDVNYNGIDFPTWGMWEDMTCYFINYHDELDHCHKAYCEHNEIPVIEWTNSAE